MVEVTWEAWHHSTFCHFFSATVCGHLNLHSFSDCYTLWSLQCIYCYRLTVQGKVHVSNWYLNFSQYGISMHCVRQKHLCFIILQIHFRNISHDPSNRTIYLCYLSTDFEKATKKSISMEAEKGNFTRFRNLRIPHPANINHAGCGTRGSATRIPQV